MYRQVWKDIEKIRSGAPLVHNITNYVVMNSTANALLALGASPVMAHAREEVEDMVGIASALVVNIGTLSGAWIESMSAAVRAAAKRGIPIVLDPVGAGATPLRTRTVHDLLTDAGSVILRGNASEIRALWITGSGTKGVDSTDTADAALDAGRFLAGRHKSVVSISGATDIIVSETQTSRVLNGHPMMPRVTGLGCTASAITGAFSAVNPDPFQAATHAMVLMGIAGEIAAENAAGPGSMQLQFLDTLYRIQETDIQKRIRMEFA
jgi:hydroxyethylthiazole kinase